MAESTALNADDLRSYISNYQTVVSYLDNQERYYEGNNSRISDETNKKDPDERVAIAYARKIVNNMVGYMFKPGNITYSLDTEEENPDYMQAIKEIYDKNNEPLINQEAATGVCIAGRSYKLFMITDSEEGVADISFGYVSAKQIVPFYTDDLRPKLKAVIYSYPEEILQDGQRKYKMHAWYIDDVGYYKYETDAVDSITYNAMYYGNTQYKRVEEKDRFHEVGFVPVVEHYVTIDKRNIYYHVIDMIDQQDQIFSKNIANELRGISEAILATSMYIDDETRDGNDETQYDKLLRMKIAEGLDKNQGEFIEWVLKNFDGTFVFESSDRIHKLIYQIAQVADFDDEKFFSNVSGVAQAFKILSMEFLATTMQSYFEIGLDQQHKIVTKLGQSISTYSSAMSDPVPIKTNWQRNVPRNTKEAVEIFNMVDQKISKEDAFKVIPEIVGDPAKAVERFKEEQEAQIELISSQMQEPEIPINNDGE